MSEPFPHVPLPPFPRQFRVKAVGVTFSDDYPENLTRLAPAVERAANEGKLLGARLVRDPENPHDANAIRVVVPEVGHIGHIPRDLAAKLAPRLDEAEMWRCQISAVLIHPDHRDRPGIDLLITHQPRSPQ